MPTMKNFLFILTVCAGVSALLSAEVDNSRSKPPTSLLPPSEFGTTVKTTPPHATTTADTPTTTAGTSNITTSAPNVTTSAPNVTTNAPNVTTSAPNSTTSTPVTTLPPNPTQSANLTVGNYNLNTNKGVLCLMAHMALQIKVKRAEVNGTFIVQPSLTNVAGSCEPPNANLTLAFKEGFITLLYKKNTTENAVYVSAVSFNLSYPFSSGANVTQFDASNASVRLFAAELGHSYSCKMEQLFMGNGLYLEVTRDRMQAFNLTGDKDFGYPEPCAAERQDYRVAIAVGIVLLVLIVIVVIAYLLGRRKRTDGYQSL